MPQRSVAFLAAGLFAAALQVYLPVLENGFVNYDDDLYIENVPQVRDGLSVDGFRWAFTTFQGANWFPLTRLSWMLDAELFGLDSRAFHATNALLHALASALLLVALARATRAPGPSAFVAGVFALHPLHVESVAWAAARKDVLSGVFFATALLSYTTFARASYAPRRRRAALATVASLALGLLSKPTLVTFPFALLLLDLWPFERLRDASGRLSAARVGRATLEKLPLFALVAAACAITLAAQGSGGAVQSLEVISFGARLANAVVAYAIYLEQTFWPVDLAVFYPHPGADLAPASVAGCAAVLAAITVVALALVRRRPYLCVGWLWYLGTLVPVIGLVQVGQAAHADRYTYLPLVGVGIAVAFLAHELAGSRRARAALAVVGVAALAALGAAASRQVMTWRDSESLFAHALEATGRNHVAHINLGVALRRAGRIDDAAVQLEEAARLRPESPRARGILGEVRLAEGRAAEAIPHLRAAASLDPESPRWRRGLAEALLRGGRPDDAARELERILRREPGRTEVRARLGAALLEAGEPARALPHLERAAREQPTDGAIRAHLAQALVAVDRLDEAASRAREAVSAEPGSAEIHALLGRIEERRGQTTAAIAAYREAVRLGLRPVELLNNLAWLLATAPDARPAERAEAIELAREAALATERREPAVLDTLATAHAAAGEWDAALAAAREALALAEAGGRAALAASLRARIATWAAAEEPGRLEGVEP